VGLEFAFVQRITFDAVKLAGVVANLTVEFHMRHPQFALACGSSDKGTSDKWQADNNSSSTLATLFFVISIPAPGHSA
jgi:hypothetical protein